MTSPSVNVCRFSPERMSHTIALCPTGLTLGAYSGRIIAEHMLGTSGPADLGPFRIDRFP